MNPVTLLLVAAILSLLGCNAPSVQLTLPPDVYVVVGTPTSIYLANVILTEHPERYRLEMISSVRADSQANRWTVDAHDRDVGTHRIHVLIRDDRGRVTDVKSTRLHVAPRDAGRPLRVLLVGDSLTAAGVYPAALARLMSSSTFVSHGVGGWRYAYALSSPTSPFLDVDAYVRDAFAGVPPDVVTFELGINDVFNGSRDLGNMDDPADVERAIDIMLESADALLTRFRASMPAATFGIALVTPPNARESAFEANYGARVPPVHQASWRRAQHRTVQRQIAHFGGREREGILLIPTEVSLDPWAGFPIDNALHPNALGYEQIATTFHAWAVNLPLRHGTW